jgi:1,4-alpha-glucan branching enzyme
MNEMNEHSRFDEVALYLFGQGKDTHLYQKMGAHPCLVNGVQGTHFATWAPGARSVAVVGDFNKWNRSAHTMQLRHDSLGIWECFIPGASIGQLYKFAISSQYHRYRADRSDPYGFAFELRPHDAAIITDLSLTQWNDHIWMNDRAKRQAPDAPIAIYEVHAGSWRHVPERHIPGSEQEDRFLTYREMAQQLGEYLEHMHFTHVEFLPITEHPFDGSWGYQTSGYFAPTSRFGSPEDFRFLIDSLHQRGIGVILDWVPSHFTMDAQGFSFFDGTHLYEYADPRKGIHKEWGTYVFDYGRSEVRNFLLASALFWLREYHIDGLRLDAVASMLYLDYFRPAGEWVLNQYGGRENVEAITFLQGLNQTIHEEFPDVLTIAEESTTWTGVSRPVQVGGLGFNLKWNMGWMHDTLKYMEKDPIHRTYRHYDMTFSMMYAYSEHFILPLSHDEVVHLKKSLISKMPGDLWQQFAGLRAYYGFMWAHPGKKHLFMGGEFGQWHEWTEQESLDWHLLTPPSDPQHVLLQSYVQTLNICYQETPALSILDDDPSGFLWLESNDAWHSIFAFVRRTMNSDESLICLCNFTPLPREQYRIGVPVAGIYYEWMNSDAAKFGGSGVVCTLQAQSEPIAWHGCAYSIVVTLPPLSTVYIKKLVPC